jgi:hypothetical protein
VAGAIAGVAQVPLSDHDRFHSFGTLLLRELFLPAEDAGGRPPGAGVKSSPHRGSGGKSRKSASLWKKNLRFSGRQSAGPIFGSASSDRCWQRLPSGANYEPNFAS